MRVGPLERGLREFGQSADWKSTGSRRPNGQILITGYLTQGTTRGLFYVARLGTNGNLVEDLHFLPLVPQSNGEVHLAFRGQKANPYVLQASSDLIQWTAIATNDRPAVPIGFIDRDAGRFPQRFYRVH